MKSKRMFAWALVLASVIALGFAVDAFGQPRLPPGDESGPGPNAPDPLRVLGEKLFSDSALSQPIGQSCASCHEASAGWSDPMNALDPLNSPTSEGAVKGRFGYRNSLTVAYGDFTPAFFYDTACRCFVGGRYRDGRVDSATRRAQDAFLNPLEMNNPKVKSVVKKVQRSSYALLFEEVFGRDIWDDPNRAIEGIGRALEAYQTTPPLNRFSSRYDRHLRGVPTALTARERTGLQLFEGKGKCSACHPSQKRPDNIGPLFTTFSFYNIGLPQNPRNPFYDMPKKFNPDGRNFVDLGLGKARNLPQEDGKFKVPSLRNVAVTPPYTHNGVFATLQDVVAFHNTRDVEKRWGLPEVPRNISTGQVAMNLPAIVANPPAQPPDDPPEPGGGGGQLGNLGLSQWEVDSIVAFLETLTDEGLGAP